MRKEAVIRLPAADGVASWLVCQPGGRDCGHVGRGELEDAARETAACRTIVLVPSVEVLLTTANLPATNRRQLQRALPFALEEQLASDVDDLHFAAGPRTSDHDVPVAVVARERMDAWQEALETVDLRPERMVPEVLALPLAEGQWTVLLERGRVLVKQSTTEGFAIEPDDLEVLLSIALQRAETMPGTVRLLDCGGGLAEAAAAVCAEAGVATEREYGSDGAVFLAAAGADSAGIDLLQGDYSHREQLGRLWRPWRPAAGLLAALLLVQGVMAGYELHRLQGEERRLEDDIEQIYRQTFPDSTRIVNARAQMEQRLKQLQSGDRETGFVSLMSAVGPVLGRSEGMELNGMRYRDGMLEFDLVLKDLQTLDRLKQALGGDRSLEVEIDTASARDDRVESRLRIRSKDA